MSKDTRIALLSNVNMNFVIRGLASELEVYQTEGYGNELGILMNPASSYYDFAPSVTFLVMDLAEILLRSYRLDEAKERIVSWFSTLRGCLKEEGIYYLSDTRLWGAECECFGDPFLKRNLEQLWEGELETLCREFANVRRFPFGELLDRLGAENAYSMKTWYMGKILLSSEAQKRLEALILNCVEVEERVPKKVLLLDLDNTLWGGLAGEAEHTPIVLSEDHRGLAYKNFQRVLEQLKKQGVLLAIVSKNNEEDAWNIVDNHPHMVLRRECFAAAKINWLPKHENIEALAGELNLGLDSFVFVDDNPAERELVKQMLPQVIVPEFPNKPEELSDWSVRLYKEYFQKSKVTAEDMEKTEQYRANEQRSHLQKEVASFEEYLKQLSMVLTREEPVKNMDRLLQLLNKTNQFNLTTIRHTYEELSKLCQDSEKEVFFYRVEDCFGDNGLVAAAIVDWKETPCILEFVMSCRVMGRKIEEVIIGEVAKASKERGNSFLRACYASTAKNQPVAKLYENLGFRRLPEGIGSASYECLPSGASVYETDLARIASTEGIARVVDGRK